jgi:hypothetical protein
MAEQITVREVYVMLRDDLQKRPDIGFRRTLADHLLETLSPFDPNSARRPHRWFVLSLIVSLAAVGSVVYFNFWN